jgi:hypothetical protein
VRKRWVLPVAVASVMATIGVIATSASGGVMNIKATLTGFEEVPALSTTANATFSARQVSPGEFEYTLSYADFESPVTQAHIHFGQKSVNGGISVFLCTNLGNGPAGTQACPAAGGTITGTFTAASVIGPSGQGIAAGQLDELVAAMDAGITYCNIHTTTFAGGEARGQIKA